ncbi:MAG: hypothetical protein DRI61_02490 [Chloroflexi bacterium]|nr:MAG: hypothetical protein DRI61_02490 [Chloroflexota bacterium]
MALPSSEKGLSSGQRNRPDKDGFKVCFISDTYPPQVGGLAISVRRMAHSLAQAGHSVHVVTVSEALSPGTVHTESDGPITVHCLGTHKRLRDTLTDWFETAVKLDATEDFDFFHGYFLAYAGYIAALAARYTGKKSVVSARGNDLDVMPFDPNRAPFTFKALEWADAVTAVTRDLARKAQAISGRRDVRVIHNGVDADLFAPSDPDPELRTTLGLDRGPIVGFVGEARAKKGVGRLLRIFPRIHEATGAQLVLIGSARKDAQEMLDFFRRRHPEVPLTVVPPQPHEEMPRYYALLNVVVMPSLRDGLPNTLLEAMACGRPVIASAVGGMMDVITDGIDGILLPPRDDDAWVEAITRILQNPEKGERLGHAARQTILNRFTIGQEVEAILALYREL